MTCEGRAMRACGKRDGRFFEPSHQTVYRAFAERDGAQVVKLLMRSMMIAARLQEMRIPVMPGGRFAPNRCFVAASSHFLQELQNSHLVATQRCCLASAPSAARWRVGLGISAR